VCGYSASSNVPRSIKNAMLLMVGHWYENREETFAGNFGQTIMRVPIAVNSLLAPYRVFHL